MSRSRRYFHTELSFNYRMTNVQAALGVAQMERVEDLVAAKRQIRTWYGEELNGHPALTLNQESPNTRNVYWMTSVLLAAGTDSVQRIAGRMLVAGIDTRPFFVPMSQLPHLSGLRQVGVEGDRCVAAADLASRGLNLPSGGGLTQADVARVAAALMATLS
jgi:perosamine synthetase